MPSRSPIAWVLASATLLVLLGIAGIARAEQLAGEPLRYAKQQAVWGSLALIAALAGSRMPLSWLKSCSGWFYLASLSALALTHSFPAVNGAHRWIRLGPLGMQPSELTKLVFILLLARVLASEPPPLRTLAVVKSLAVLLPALLLILAEPNLGTAVLIVSVAGIVLWMAGLSRNQLAAGFLAGLCMAPLAWPQMTREQRSRVTALFAQRAPQVAVGDDGYQLHQAKQIRALGGWTGSWLSDDATTDRTAYHLPEARTDFIASVLGERFGLCGLLGVLSLYFLIVWQGVGMIACARDRFARLLATGIVSLFALEAIVNLGMNAGLLPVAGLSLPLVSYGGSGMLVHGAALGLLWNAGRAEPIP